MPTVILLDVSLSMACPVPIADCTEEYTRRNLAVHGISTLLDYAQEHSKLEFIAMLVFSSQYEQLSGFTREYAQIKTALDKVTEYDKTCIEVGLAGVSTTVIGEWGTGVSTQVILITDGNSGVGSTSLQHILAQAAKNPGDEKFPIPFSFTSKLHVVCIAPSDDPVMQKSLPHYRNLIDMNGGQGDLYTVDGALTLKSVEDMFNLLSEQHLKPLTASLTCGHLKCTVNVQPPPDKYIRKDEGVTVSKSVSSELIIVGFMDIADACSPAALSKHLLLPVQAHTEKPVQPAGSGSGEEEEAEEGGKSAAFTVLLHGSLKVEGMVAITQVADGWYGMIYSWADSKKKSNLMLALFQPGTSGIPWLGDLAQLAPMEDFDDAPYGIEGETKTPFPVRPVERRSYGQNCVVWIKPSGIQADVQKILRHARKLPEKSTHFYKELNRLRRAALSFGFLELLECLGGMLERECTLLPGTAHPDAALQLTHAVNNLRSPRALDIATPILPLRTNFTSD